MLDIRGLYYIYSKMQGREQIEKRSRNRTNGKEKIQREKKKDNGKRKKKKMERGKELGKNVVLERGGGIYFTEEYIDTRQ